MGKNDSRILAIVTRELVAAEACYHKSCYRDYTRNFKELLAVVIRKRKMSVLNIPMQNHKPKRTPSEMKDQKVNTGIFKPITRLNSGEKDLKEQTSIHSFCITKAARLHIT